MQILSQDINVSVGSILPGLTSLDNVQMTGLSVDDFLRWNGTKWVNRPDPMKGSIIFASEYGVVADDTTDCRAALQAALDATPEGGICQLPGGGDIRIGGVGVFVDRNRTLRGTHTPRWGYRGGSPSCLKPHASFTGKAIINLVDYYVRNPSSYNSGTGNIITAETSATEQSGMRIENIAIDGNSSQPTINSGEGIQGIRLEGLVRDVIIVDVDITQTSGKGYVTIPFTRPTVASGYESGGSFPRGVYLDMMSVNNAGTSSSANHCGFDLRYQTDSTCSRLLAVSCEGSGFKVQGGGEIEYTGCRAVFCGEYGFELYGANSVGGHIFNGCSTDRNGFDGWNISMTGDQPIILNACLDRRNGSATDGATVFYANVNVDGSSGNLVCPVIVRGAIQTIGLDDPVGGVAGGQLGPEWGMRVDYGSYVSVDGFLWGKTEAFTNTGTSTRVRISTNSFGFIGDPATRVDLPAGPYAPLGLTGATSLTRYVGGTASAAPVSGTWGVGDWVIARDGHIWICTVSGTSGTWIDAGGYGSGGVSLTSTAPVADGPTATVGAGTTAARHDHVHPYPTYQRATGTTGATTLMTWVGGTASGAPTTGTFAVGDWVLTRDGHIWICTVAGTPGTWIDNYPGIGGVAGQTLGSRFVGYLNSAGPPTTGTWVARDHLIDSNKMWWVCITGGTPGVWDPLGPAFVNQVATEFNPSTWINQGSTVTVNTTPSTITVASTSEFPSSGTFLAGTGTPEDVIPTRVTVTYTGKTATTFTGCTTPVSATIPNLTHVWYASSGLRAGAMVIPNQIITGNGIDGRPHDLVFVAAFDTTTVSDPEGQHGRGDYDIIFTREAGSYGVCIFDLPLKFARDCLWTDGDGGELLRIAGNPASPYNNEISPMAAGTIEIMATLIGAQGAGDHFVLRNSPTANARIKFQNSASVDKMWMDDTGVVIPNNTDFRFASSGAAFGYMQVTSGGTFSIRFATSAGFRFLSAAGGVVFLCDDTGKFTMSAAIVQKQTDTAHSSNGALTINAALGNSANVALTANVTSSSITNPVDGQILTISFTQDATGGRTYVWPTNCKFAGNGPAPSSTWPNKRVSVTFEYDGTNWLEIARSFDPTVEPNSFSGTTYTYATAVDNGRMLRSTGNSAVTLTLPNNAAPGEGFTIRQVGTGQVELVAASGATRESFESVYKTAGQRAVASAWVDTNTTGTNAAWVIDGNIGP